MNENKKREIIGVVVSDKADKTITVKVETYKMNPIYGKRVKYSKKFAAHVHHLLWGRECLGTGQSGFVSRILW